MDERVQNAGCLRLGQCLWHELPFPIRQTLVKEVESCIWQALMKGAERPAGRPRVADKLEDFSFDYEQSRLADAYQTQIEDSAIRQLEDVCQKAKTPCCKDSSALVTMSRAAYKIEEKLLDSAQSGQALVPEFASSLEGLHAELVRQLDSVLEWRKGRDTWGFEDIKKFLEAYRKEVETWAGAMVPGFSRREVDKASLGIRNQMALREREWFRLGLLSRCCPWVTERMISAHARDMRSLVSNAFLLYKYSLISNFSASVIEIIDSLESSLCELMEGVADYRSDILRETKPHGGPSDETGGEYEDLNRLRRGMLAGRPYIEHRMYELYGILRAIVSKDKPLIACNREELARFAAEMHREVMADLAECLYEKARKLL